MFKWSQKCWKSSAFSLVVEKDFSINMEHFFLKYSKSEQFLKQNTIVGTKNWHHDFGHIANFSGNDLKTPFIFKEHRMSPSLFYASFNVASKVIYPKYSKHWPYTVASTIDCVCSKMLSHGLNHGLSFIWIVWSTLYVYLWLPPNVYTPSTINTQIRPGYIYLFGENKNGNSSQKSKEV